MNISPENYRSQFLSFDNQDLQWSTCAIACISMVLKELDQNQEPIQVLKDLVAMHGNKGEVVKRKFNLDDEEMAITVGMKDEVDQLGLQMPEDYVMTEPGPFQPSFTLTNGYDHRASKEYFEKFGLKTYFIEDYTFNDLVRDLETQRYRFILASIHSLRTRANHIVVATNVGSDETGRYIEFVDPGEKEYELAIKRQDFKFFEFIFNNRATVIL